MSTPSARRWPLYSLGAGCICLAVLAIGAAVGWYGHPIAGVFVDPGGVVSNLGLSRIEAQQTGLHFPDVVLEVDQDRLISRGGAPRARVWDEAVERAFRTGRNRVQAKVQTVQGPRTLSLNVRPLEPVSWWLYAGSLLFAGGLYVAAGLIALWASPRNALARTFGKVGISTGVLLWLMFDFHSTRVLAPAFLVAFAMVPMSWVVLALRLPDDAPVLRRFPALERVADLLGIAVAICFLILYWSGRETRQLQDAWSSVLVWSFLFFAATFIIRFVTAEGVRRDRLRALLISVASPHLAALAVRFPSLRDDVGEAVSFCTLSLLPLATAYAFIRYDLWGSRALLSRVLTRLGVSAVACTVAILVGTALAARSGVPFGGALVAAGIGGVLGAVLVVAALGATDRHVFASRLSYKPTVEQLSEELVSITSPEEVARAVERTIRRWLPCKLVELSLPTETDVLPNSSTARRVEPMADPSTRTERLMLPLEFGGVALGRLVVGEKAGSALFTDDDLDLLRTIANQGALALAHAYAYRELEARRREQAAAWRGERAALVETVAAEIAHEIRYPINFFRSVFAAAERPLDREDFDIGREEVERLERLVSGLRRLAGRALERKRVRVVWLCERVETLLRDELAGRQLQLAVPILAELDCDPDQVMQVLTNLVANGLHAAGTAGAVGVAWLHAGRGAELVVWDTGPGFEGDSSRLFAPWYTTKPKGTGLGLAITHRIVRSHGWNITAQRRDNRTLFLIAIRAEDVVSGSDLPDHTKPSAEVA
jgi:signal transduction histidine kinase